MRLENHAVIAVQDITTEHRLLGDDLQPRTVLSTTRGYGQLYVIVPSDGGLAFTCNEHHILTLQTNHLADITDMAPTKLKNFDRRVDVPLHTYLGWSASRRQEYSLARVDLSEFERL